MKINEAYAIFYGDGYEKDLVSGGKLKEAIDFIISYHTSGKCKKEGLKEEVSDLYGIYCSCGWGTNNRSKGDSEYVLKLKRKYEKKGQ